MAFPGTEDLTPDDEDKKVRRNLVGFSGAILLFAWLEIPPGVIAEKLIGTGKVSGVPLLDPFSVWSAAATVLGYLAARFHFFGGGKEAFKKLADKWKTQLHWYIDAAIKRQKQDVVSVVCNPAWKQVIRRADERLAESGYSGVPPPTRSTEFRVDAHPVNEGRWTFKGDGRVTVTFTNPVMQPPTTIVAHAESVKYVVAGALRVKAISVALWQSWIFSEEAVALMFPAWLAASATGVIAFRLAQALL